MQHIEVVHISPVNNAWRVYRLDHDIELSFEQLGDALDAAAKLVPDGIAVRIVLDESDSHDEVQPDVRRSAG